MSRSVYLGLDLGSTVCEAVARDGGGKILGSLKFPPGERELRRAVVHFKGEVRVLLACLGGRDLKSRVKFGPAPVSTARTEGLRTDD